jgi:hypothetical protein
MFSTKNGLYERARQRFKIQDGIKLFSYPFYKQRRMDVQVRMPRLARLHTAEHQHQLQAGTACRKQPQRWAHVGTWRLQEQAMTTADAMTRSVVLLHQCCFIRRFDCAVAYTLAGRSAQLWLH